MIYYLLMCTMYHEAVCMPAQRFESKRECVFVGIQYKKIVRQSDHTIRFAARCVGMNKKDATR